MPIRAALFATAIGLALAASPAAAADLATISCVRDQTAPASVELLLESARTAARGEPTARTPETLHDQLFAAATKCQKLHGWSDAAGEAAAKYTFVALRLEAMRPLAESKGVHYADVTTALAAMTQGERDLLLTGGNDGVGALVRELNKLGVTGGNEASELYGRLAALTLLVEKSRKDFAAN